MHGNALEEAEKLAARLREELKPVELFINITGPVLGLHTGQAHWHCADIRKYNRHK